MKKFYDKITCALIGWDYDILKQCREASYRTKNKYVSALIIVSIIWGVIGYKFASKYIDIESLPGCLAVAFAFIVLVNCIERIIIMKQGKAVMIYAFRIILALCMAILGAFIFDQILFERDLKTQINRNKEKEIREVVQYRMEECNNDIKKFTAIRDSLFNVNVMLYDQLKDNPVIIKRNVNTRQVVAGHDKDGNPIMRTLSEVVNTPVDNPLNNQVKDNDKELENNQKMLVHLQNKKDSTEINVTTEIMSRPIGFMEELDASIQVFFKGTLTTIVYVILFVFMLGLELFVCSISWFEKDCDYDLVVEHQLKLKSLELQDAERKYKKKYITGELPDEV